MRDGLGDGFDFSVTVAGEDRGVTLGFTVEWVGFCVVVRRWASVVDEGVTVLPGVVTVSEAAVVVVVVVVSLSPSICRRTKLAGASITRKEVTATLWAARQPLRIITPNKSIRAAGFTLLLLYRIRRPAREINGPPYTRQLFTSLTKSSMSFSVTDHEHIKR